MGMFGNRFDTMSVLDDALYKEGLGVGQLSSYGVGQMAAYTEGRMGNPFSAAVNDLMSPEMQKQKLLDELQKKHPSPDTPEELMALADDLTANGFGDMAQKVRVEATNLINAQAATLKATQPSADLYKNLSSALSTQVLTKPFINDYFIEIGRPELAQPYKKGSGGFNTYEDYKNERKAYVDDLENMFTQWGMSYKYNGTDKNTLATLRNDDASMTDEFLIWAGQHGNSELAEIMKKRMRSADPTDNAGSTAIVVRNERNGQTEEVDIKRPDVQKIIKQVENINNVDTVRNQIVQMERAIKNGTNNEMMQIKLQILQQRLIFLNPEGEEKSVENDWLN